MNNTIFPYKIEPCPIVDTVVEIRFNTNLFSNAVFGVIFNEFQNDFSSVEKLPILQIPEQLRDIDPNFKYKPHYKITDGTNIIQIGSDVIAISAPIPYVGWDLFSKLIYNVLDRLFKINIITNVTRLGVRYVNFFETDIFRKIKLSLSIENKEHYGNNTIIRTEIQKNNLTNLIQIANNVIHGVNPKNGSIIDIDTFKDYSDFSFADNYKLEIESAHKTEKELFFSILNEDFLKTLNPSYDVN